MKRIDLHIHSNCSDGQMSPSGIFQEASRIGIGLISITDHDSIDCQAEARKLADEFGIEYMYGLELNVTYSHPEYGNGKSVSLDFLAYQFDIEDTRLIGKLEELRQRRKKRAEEILEKINYELASENLREFTSKDLEAIEQSVDGAFGRPHIADYMVKKGIVDTRQEAFDKYLVKCNAPKMPLSLEEASRLIRGAGGKLFLAHPNHPRGTSLIKITKDVHMQQVIIGETMLTFIDGIECWHSAHDRITTESYIEFAKKNDLMVTGGSDCHQQPLLIGSVDIPDFVGKQFGFNV
jgi:predicted metal-dependent phosphoesterase TrpH